MTFREGLLKARGQLTFIAALAISTGIIIHLEALDTEAHIQGRVATELSRQRNAPATVAPGVDAAVRTNLRRSEEAYAAQPGAPETRAALLAALSSAVQLGIVRPEDGLSRAQRVLADMERQRGEPSAVVDAALGTVAVAFPTLQERVAALSGGSKG